MDYKSLLHTDTYCERQQRGAFHFLGSKFTVGGDAGSKRPVCLPKIVEIKGMPLSLFSMREREMEAYMHTTSLA
jgi:hypothetical protein